MIPQENKVTLRGTVVSINTGGMNTPTIRLFCNSRNKSSKGNFPLVYVFDKKLLSGISLQSKVLIFGHTQNRRVYFEDTKKHGSKTIVCADMIFPAQRMLADYFSAEDIPVSEGPVAEDINRITLCGTVLDKSSFNNTDDYMRLRIQTEREGFTTQCDITCSRRQKEKADTFKEGDTIIALCYIFTNKKKDENKNTLYYEQIFCQDIEKIS